MITDTAPVTTIVIVNQSENTENNIIDVDKINEFYQKINICSSCTNIVAAERPMCSILNKPLSIVSNIQQCPEGKW